MPSMYPSTEPSEEALAVAAWAAASVEAAWVAAWVEASVAAASEAVLVAVSVVVLEDQQKVLVHLKANEMQAMDLEVDTSSDTE